MLPSPMRHEGAESLTSAERDQLAETFATLCVEAGAAVMDVYGRGCQHLRVKADRSPVSEADELAEAIIIKRMRLAVPALSIVAEESCAKFGKPRITERFILVDPA